MSLSKKMSQLTFKDIRGLVEQNVQLRSLVRSFSDQIVDKEMEFKVASNSASTTNVAFCDAFDILHIYRRPFT